MYGNFALVYDRLMRGVDYEAWAAHYRALLKSAGVKDGALVLEAACGTGNLTLLLARHYNVLPSDVSPDMLSIAAKKARAAGLEVTFVRQDMRCLSAHRKADAVVCACDGVNYLTSPKALSAFFNSAYQALKPGGVLAFDVSTIDKLSRVLGNAPQVERGEDISYIWENAWQARGLKLHLSLSLFEKQEDGRYLRIDEEQIQKAWPETQLKAALGQAGFKKIKVFGNLTFSKPRENSQRMHLIAQK